ncbi:hypothetical protein SARC_00767 [Sphaeroforma arctica JP610]|uniref:Uncharacterized protein n=1 Tax=Sphaeroforma arctica JP610 TaxID=667725 RepID=A0A0L0GDZ5_9EUKA|nr:hypothetical protein SARC_00767 [Sphaeroforma arctica JP610]KNC87091.1 hypothetical protein SARC_00767 [Sphaeroforma arctica JP610]|eukprot:XP_014160993.1 hypothetical protein SARC_00767 [Sphaeroforma arctica JP610]
MKNPRVHTTKRYQRNRMRPREEYDADVHWRASTRSSADPSVVNEERALRLSLQVFDVEFEELPKTCASIVERLAECQDVRVKRAQGELAEKIARARKMAEEREREQLVRRRANEARERIEMESAAREKRKQKETRAKDRSRLGEFFLSDLRDGSDEIRFDKYTRVVALGSDEEFLFGGCDYALAFDYNDTYFTSGMIESLHDRLESRAPHHPPKVDATLGSAGQYQVRFANGTSQFRFWDKSLNVLGLGGVGRG